ncbi:MAG TPA: hypothetical protein VNG90_02640, partial [Candidatus Acidoferrum sp.]|nr:hypothetical protein [Candidatus Acidoferrum sp.]
SSGIDRRIGTLPAGFGQATILAAGQGIGATFDTWGHALTDLQGKTRPSNQADTLLKYLSYWTDAGAEYYYHFDPGAGSYPATLLAIKNEYDQKNVPIKSMQIDSWWYPKGWDNGMLSYTADPNIWTTDDPTVNGTAELQNFQRQLNLPTIFHARWVSDYSPYFGQYAMSGHVSIDPAYWKNAMDYIKALGATTYEQDWLDIKATPDFNLSDPETFMDTMAAAARADGLNLQYCMEVPDQVLQGTKYNNLLTMRTSIDRFDRNRWEPDLWTSQLAKAVGTWPWVDNFRSSETNNLLLADLSAGPVGPGDALGTVDAANLQKVIRADSEIVKPDQPLVPTDATYINDAAGHTDQPFIASTFTDFGTSKAEYVAAFPRPYGTLQTANFKPSDFGFTGNVYIYDYFTGQGEVARAASVFTDKIDTLHYYIIVPIGPSGVALLGDQSKFVSLGKQRVTSLTDNGTLEASLTFAPNDPPVTLRGYSPTKPTIRASQGKLDSFVYDTKSHTFAITIKPSSQYMAKISLSLKPPIKAPAKRFLPTFLLTTHPR